MANGHPPGLAAVGYVGPAALSVGTVVLNWYSQNIGVIVGTVALIAYGAMFIQWLLKRPDE